MYSRDTPQIQAATDPAKKKKRLGSLFSAETAVKRAQPAARAEWRA